MTELEKLSHDSFYNMQNYSQITIDYIEDVEDAIENNKDMLESLSYRILTIIEIISPALETDVNAFFKLNKIINEILAQ
jgi:hypothetical protein